jgi:glucose/arabinose dehydrogenase
MYLTVRVNLVLSYLLFWIPLCTLTLCPSLVSYDNVAYTAYASDRPYGGERGASQPVINDPNLKLELVSEGLELPAQMAFIGPNDILVLEKDTGMVKRIVNGTILEEPMLDVNVATAYERGLLGIAIAKNGNETTQKNASIVYLYYTESEEDAPKKMPMMIAPVPLLVARRMSP